MAFSQASFGSTCLLWTSAISESFIVSMPCCFEVCITLPSWKVFDRPSIVDVVVVPAIDGNFDPSVVEMIPFERQFQTLHSLQNYFLLNELLAVGQPMPMVDSDALRRSRAAFVARFAERPYFFVRAATPQVLLDKVDESVCDLRRWA